VIGVEPGASGTRAGLFARQNKIFIPTLCNLRGLTNVGACRLCLVEVKGPNRLFPACVTRVEEGMEVTTISERLDRYRKAILELLFVERNHISVCVSNGHCELQALAQRLQLTRKLRWMGHTSASSSTTIAFSVRGASGCARKSRVLTPHRPEPTLGLFRKPVPDAASACTSVPPALCPKKGGRWLRC